MLADSRAFSGFAVQDLDRARSFYADTLGLRTTVLDEQNGLMQLELAGERNTLVYRQADATPASYTILNFPVDDIDAVVDSLAERGVAFERYDGLGQDDKGIARGLASGWGPDIAWFKDPSGNVLSVLQEAR
jgi:catechol 2,3-dioxygenase-like lactoylglutathione lyase family enzyme